MKTFIENAKNAILVASNEKGWTADEFDKKFDNTYFFLNDGKESHRANVELYTDLYKELQENGIKAVLFYEYDFALNMLIRKAMVDAGFKFGDIITLDVVAVHGKLRKNQPIQVIYL